MTVSPESPWTTNSEICLPDSDLGQEFFARPAEAVAREVLGCEFAVGPCAGRIVEVEWYTHDDPASHSFRGPTPRCMTMFGPPGHLYVYRSYGVHWCANIVCEAEGVGAAVLIRALEPVDGVSQMATRRGVQDPRLLCSGPGRLTQALGIDGAFDGVRIGTGGVHLRAGLAPDAVLVGPRIGISQAVDWPRRRGEAGSRYLSRPFPKEAICE